jgi:hypothetical protein
MTLRNSYIIDKTKKTRVENDYYPTAPLATECLINIYGSIIPSKIWEPAAGRGWISKTLINKGYEVVSTDLHAYKDPLVDIETGVDYLLTSPKASCIITNPPYKNNLAYKFAKKAVEESNFVALFLRLTFMEGTRRYEFFNRHPPTVLVFSGRMNCDETKFHTYSGQLGGMVAYAWFVWSKDLPGHRIDWINPKNHIPINTIEKFISEEQNV